MCVGAKTWSLSCGPVAQCEYGVCVCMAASLLPCIVRPAYMRATLGVLPLLFPLCSFLLSHVPFVWLTRAHTVGEGAAGMVHAWVLACHSHLNKCACGCPGHQGHGLGRCTACMCLCRHDRGVSCILSSDMACPCLHELADGLQVLSSSHGWYVCGGIVGVLYGGPVWTHKAPCGVRHHT